MQAFLKEVAAAYDYRKPGGRVPVRAPELRDIADLQCPFNLPKSRGEVRHSSWNLEVGPQLPDELISEDLRDFILRHIDSIAQLEALLLLRRHPGETWTAASSAQRLYIGEADASSVLEHLCAAGLLSCAEGQYRFAGQSEDNRAMIEGLAESYANHLIQVTNLIHGKPRRLREFADAFKLRKDRQ